MSIPILAGTVSTVIFAGSVLPMLVKAARTKDLGSYSLGHILLANLGNAIHTVYVLNLPIGPIWALHGFYVASTGFMLVCYLRYAPRRAQSSALGRDQQSATGPGQHAAPDPDQPAALGRDQRAALGRRQRSAPGRGHRLASRPSWRSVHGQPVRAKVAAHAAAATVPSEPVLRAATD